MKLRNRQNNNYFYFKDNVMRGTIEMTKKEWEDVREFLLKEHKIAVDNCNTAIRDGLNSGFVSIEVIKKKINVGITATRLIVCKYNLKNYKDVNYLIIIK